MTLEELQNDCREINGWSSGMKPYLCVDCATWDELHRIARTDDKVELDRGYVWYDGVEIRLDHAI